MITPLNPVDLSKGFNRMKQSVDMCLSKRSYRTKEFAESVIEKLKIEKNIEFLRCYNCPKCKQWHLTKQKSKKEELLTYSQCLVEWMKKDKKN